MRLLVSVGRPLAFVTLLREGFGNELTASIVKAISPHTKVLERWYYEPPGVDWTKPDLYAVGYNMVVNYVARFQIDRNADWHQIINEPVTGIGTASSWMGAMAAAKVLGIKLAVGCWPETHPEQPGDPDTHDAGFWQRASTWDMVARVIADGHVLMSHEYVIPDPTSDPKLWANGYSMSKYERALALLPAELRIVMWVLGEYGTGKVGLMSEGDLVTCLNAGNAALHQNSANLQGAAFYSVGPWVDGSTKLNSDVAQRWDAFVRHLTTVPLH